MMAGRLQSGVALITVLLVVALATIAAVEMASHAARDKRNTGHRLALEQAHELALGGERWASSVLLAMTTSDPDQPGAAGETPDEPTPRKRWPFVLESSPIEQGEVGGEITDVQGRFNLNSLVQRGGGDAVSMSRFQRLLAELDLDTGIAAATVDWIDRDQERTYPGGAEDDFYLELAEPYRAAQTKMASASELLDVRGVDAAAWSALAPHVTALPQSTPINVNSATPVLLRAIARGLDDQAAQALASTDTRFEDLNAFLADERIAATNVRPSGLTVGSEYFRARIDIELGSTRHTLYSWLHRDADGRVRVLRRSRTAH